MVELPVVRLGNAKIKCACGNEIATNMTAKYLYECVMRFQSCDKFVMRSSYNKLQLAESILGITSRFMKEIERKKITDKDGKEYIDIFVGIK